MEHLMKFKKANPNKSLKDCMKEAKKTYTSSKTSSGGVASGNTKKSKK